MDQKAKAKASLQDNVLKRDEPKPSSFYEISSDEFGVRVQLIQPPLRASHKYLDILEQNKEETQVTQNSILSQKILNEVDNCRVAFKKILSPKSNQLVKY